MRTPRKMDKELCLEAHGQVTLPAEKENAHLETSADSGTIKLLAFLKPICSVSS